MSKYLCTFSGKFGDILWSLPTAKYIAEHVVSQPVDFAVMPYYESLLPLLAEQTYIDNAFVIKDWLRTHSNYGDQPWEAPVVEFEFGVTYERVWNLGYRCHPGAPFGNPEMALMDFIAWQQGINLMPMAALEPIIPFLTAKPLSDPFLKAAPFVVLSFNEQYAEEKKTFTENLIASSDGTVSVHLVAPPVTWVQAASLINESVAYVGDRSAMWVIANGLGKSCITFEPHPSRHAKGHLGKVFGCPGGHEIALPFGMPAAVCGSSAAAMVLNMVQYAKSA